MAGFMGELIGTAVLILFGVGTMADVNLKHAYARGTNWLLVTIAWGLAVAFGVYAAGQLGSDGHLNPAVTIGFACFGFFPWGQVLPYLAGQFLGAFIGAALVIVHYWPHFKATTSVDDGNKVGIFATAPAINDPFMNFLSEVIATFAFVFVLLNLGDFTQGLKPLVVGALITMVGLALGGTTGFALNPARDLAPRLAYAWLPVPHKGPADLAYSWVPLLGPTIGGILASGLQTLVA